MRKAFAAGGLVLAGVVLGAGLVQLGRALERDDRASVAQSPASQPATALAPVAAAPAASRPSTTPASAATLPRAQPVVMDRTLHEDPAPLIERAAAGYDRAKRAMVGQREAHVDELLLLGYVVSGDNDPALAALLSSGRTKLDDDPFVRLLDATAKAPRLDNDLDHGLIKLHAYVLGAVGEPDDAALHRLEAFAAREEQGYPLSHQVLALGWFESTGRRLTAALEARRSVLLGRIEQEQRSDTTMSDLFAERASTLMLYSAPDRAEIRRWVDTLLTAQQSDGSWGARPYVLAFDGQAQEVTPSPTHTVAHALVVLRRFLDSSTTKP